MSHTDADAPGPVRTEDDDTTYHERAAQGQDNAAAPASGSDET